MEKKDRFERVEVVSSLIKRAIYDKEENKLYVEFTFEGSSVYVYEEFRSNDFEEFKNSDSLGSHFNKKIKGFFECTKLDYDGKE